MTPALLAPPADPDRLYDLIPAVYRLRDADQGWPLRALLRVIGEQAAVIENDIDGLYRNWFVETCDAWVLPYIGGLVGYVPAGGANAVISRAEVANTIRFRRRRGTLSVVDTLAEAVAGWPARAVECYRQLAVTQNIDHLHLDRGRTAELRNVDALGAIGSPFDRTARNVDVRRANSLRARGRGNIPGLVLNVWRLQARTVTQAPAYAYEEQGANCFLFNALGADTPLFVNPLAQAPDPALPVPITRLAFERRAVDDVRGDVGSGIPFYYGPGKSLLISLGTPPVPVSADRIVGADLTGWAYRPAPGQVAVDPERGRIMLPPNTQRRQAMTVSYASGAVAAMGGGEYDRQLDMPPGALMLRVGPSGDVRRIGDALSIWRDKAPSACVIEILDSGVYAEPVEIDLAAGQALWLRAADHVRPLIRLLDWQGSASDSLSIGGALGSWCVLDGLTVTGRGVQISGQVSGVTLRHSTLVPGWGLTCDCDPKRPAEPSIEILGSPLCLTIEHSIVGAIQVERDQAATDPMTIRIADSILDATGADRIALGASARLCADVDLTLVRSTVIGKIQTHRLDLAENSILAGAVLACRRQVGCVRFCALPAGSRTPRQYKCTADTPVFDAVRYGAPAYLRLSPACPATIAAGAEDGSEMGAYHDLLQPLRLAALRQRLTEYSPADIDAGVHFAT